MFTFQLFFHILSLIFGWFMLGNFFLVPYFLLRANVPGPDKVPPLAFGESGGIVFQIITVLYAYCLLIQFLLSMGSKPSSTLTLYRMIMFLWTAMFGVTMYLLAFAAWKIITSAQIEILQLGFFVAIRGHPALISFIAAAIACWGVWIIAGIAFGDPWHVFHSVFQFMLLSPWWTNVLQVNAMANVHDVSWGTKGAAKGHALSAAKPVHGDGLKENAEVEMELPDTADIEEINRIYEEQVAQLAKPVVHEEGNAIARMFARPVIKDQEERFRTYRIVMLLIWVTSNLALVFAVTNPTIEQLMIESSGAPINPYLSLLFYTTCFFSAVKLLGMFYYLLFQRLIDFKEPIKSQYVGNTLAKRPAFRSQVSVAVA